MDFSLLQHSTLFQGLEPAEWEQALSALDVTERAYEENEMIFSAGDCTERMGLVLSGSVTIESGDIWGNRTVLSHIGAGQFFAETYALLGESMLVDVRANEGCRIAFLRLAALQGPERWAAKLTRNLLSISARKNLTLSLRSFHTAPKTVRERVTAYLATAALRTGESEFDIPFDRQQMADYLNLDRTALSKELGRMRRDGIIDFRKNHFVLRRSIQ
ncbi:MAG: Crp/Fnr family transcriptional regulator [Oscillospiraceae bacterium]|nr:Crp/Fnr family transcriptional regulator [Oscillospiraceae bacterium]